LEQSPVRLELIIVDDTSTDHRAETASVFPEVRLLRQVVNSRSGAHGRIIGLQAASGRYVKFLDHDDLLQPGALALELKAAEQHQPDMVMARWGDVLCDAKGEWLEPANRSFVPPEPSRLIEAILLGEKSPFTAGVLYRRSFIAEHPGNPSSRSTIISIGSVAMPWARTASFDSTM
jgi:glycosyltransferase involved in cell wall biosynthesis